MATKIRAIIEQASDGGYGIFCPDLDGISLFGYGESEEEARNDLKENLEEFVEFYADEAEKLLVLGKGDVIFENNYDFCWRGDVLPDFCLR